MNKPAFIMVEYGFAPLLAFEDIPGCPTSTGPRKRTSGTPSRSLKKSAPCGGTVPTGASTVGTERPSTTTGVTLASTMLMALAAHEDITG